MTHRERFYQVVTHGHPDRAVFDLTGSPQTNVDYEETRQEIAALLGISGKKQGHFNLDERILQKLDIETRRVGGMPTPVSVHNRTENGIIYDIIPLKPIFINSLRQTISIFGYLHNSILKNWAF